MEQREANDGVLREDLGVFTLPGSDLVPTVKDTYLPEHDPFSSRHAHGYARVRRPHREASAEKR